MLALQNISSTIHQQKHSCIEQLMKIVMRWNKPANDNVFAGKLYPNLRP